MTILDEIREYFASTQNGARDINALKDNYPAIVIKNSSGYGVAVEFDDKREFSENFANCKLFTQNLSIDSVEKKYLILSCMFESLRHEFASVCAQFVDPGSDGMDRQFLLQNPLEWWSKWRDLLGNAIYNKQVYSVIAEMMALLELFQNNPSVEWAAIQGSSHDIEGNNESYEVKSTIERYAATVTIAGQHQLLSPKKLFLYFCRMEKSKEGFSVNDMKDKLITSGYDKDKLEGQLVSLGFEHGASARDEKYKILERRKYVVDDKFPKITQNSFKEDKIPKSIIQITYTIDLDGLEYTEW